jgi:hypothetical protein
MSLKKVLLLAIVAFLLWSSTAFAQYTIVLKNGRRITVQTYREEGGMIKFFGMGGEIGIARDQVKTILKPGEKEERGMVVPGAEGIRAAPAESKPAEKEAAPSKTGEEPKLQEKALSPEEKQAEERAQEEKEYKHRLRELTQRLKAARDRYLLATRGSSSTEPTLLHTEEAMRARTDQLMSGLRDVQHNPSAPRDTVDVPPPAYSAKEKEISDLKNEIQQLEKERERLIEEMKQKNFETGSLFLD